MQKSNSVARHTMPNKRLKRDVQQAARAAPRMVRAGGLAAKSLPALTFRTTAVDDESDISADTLNDDRFPLSSKYDSDWLVDGCFGGNPLWLAKWLCRDVKLHPGMRVLDLGCGRAKSSVFLA